MDDDKKHPRDDDPEPGAWSKKASTRCDRLFCEHTFEGRVSLVVTDGAAEPNSVVQAGCSLCDAKVSHPAMWWLPHMAGQPCVGSRTGQHNFLVWELPEATRIGCACPYCGQVCEWEYPPSQAEPQAAADGRVVPAPPAAQAEPAESAGSAEQS